MIQSFNQSKISLIPPFQRGSVWNLSTRQKLLVNMIQGRPIPAIFLYKQADGSQFVYNILDGKQRLESLILFVGDQRPDIRVQNVQNYFFGKTVKDDLNFEVALDGKDIKFSKLDDALVAAFREYAISTIEIDLDDESASIDEIINLFIDINQQGVKVSRFDVVKALGRDKLFKQVFSLIAIKQERKGGKSRYYKAINSNFVFVLKRLNLVKRLADKSSRVDRMWERLTEIALFCRNLKHRAPAEILKAFIKPGGQSNQRLNMDELHSLRRAFDFLSKAYRAEPTLMESRIATDQPQFYTLVTTLLSTDLLQRFDQKELTKRVLTVSRMFDGKVAVPAPLEETVKNFLGLSAKQTTHPARREKRQELLIRAIDAAELIK